MEYYHDLVTQQSWQELQKLQHLIRFTLIGGWAVYLYTKALKSKDIDIICQFDQLPILKRHYELNKNDRLKKYEARKETVQIDIYLPHYSNLGIPAEDLMEHSQAWEGFNLLGPNFLAALKLNLLTQRGRTAKGRKDFLDFVTLFMTQKCNLKEIQRIIRQYNLLPSLKVLKELLKEESRVDELNLTTHQFAKIKKEILAQLTKD